MHQKYTAFTYASKQKRQTNAPKRKYLIKGNGGGSWFWQIWKESGGCINSYGWFVITTGTSCTNWMPKEGNTNPQIRYANGEYEYGGFEYGLMSNNTTNSIADSMVISLKVSNQTTFGRYFTTISTDYSFIAVYFVYETLNWFEAKDFCMTQFETSLASIHSYSQEIEVFNLMRSSSSRVWIGLNDILTNAENYDQSISAPWKYSDGTYYDYAISWRSNNPNGDSTEQCVEIFTSAGFNDLACEGELSEFICNFGNNNWRPVFKISNVTHFGNSNETSLYNYWTNGVATFSTYSEDINYVLNLFDARKVESANYRSLVIDDWTQFVTNNEFDQIKVSIYKNGKEARYFVFDATKVKNNINWFGNDSIIDSSYKYLRFGTDQKSSFFDFAGLCVFS